MPIGSGSLFTGVYLVDSQLVQGELGGYLAGVLFIIGLPLGQELAVDHGPYREEPAAPFDPLVQGLEFESFSVLIRPAIELVLMIDLQVLEVVHEQVGLDKPFNNPWRG